MHVLPNYMYIYLIMRWKICLEMEHIRRLSYLITCASTYLFVYLITCVST